MADTLKILGQIATPATTLSALYTVPAGKSATASSIVIANRGGTDATFRISVAVAGDADNTKQYIAYDAPVEANDSVVMTIGITLASTDVVRVYASNTNLSFNLFGVEI